ncbi:LysR family transcriptional regulator [Izhakiella australiensis]|uniref:LysR family transcriptional regulator n=1 Tax=Izhakiella australiensis TaxID=1926881 RepID=A0A1S8YAF8_9GAMM|nr:LysR substrate-binding domain-containing protein [Izhakiella australiensis]OON35673.1 LysR family transcriptional regulator [Izhakiella australiensis]
MHFDLADLRLFLCVTDAGSITAGAAAAGLALASASERLRNLEAEVGVSLLTRHARGVVTTEAGEALAHHARLILQQRAVLAGELQGFASGARGTLSLYANTAALTEFIPQRLADWLAARPELHLDLKERTSQEIVRTIAAGLAQAGIVSDAVDSEALQLQPVAQDHLVLIAARTHSMAARHKLHLADVLSERFVGLAAESALQQHIDHHARRCGHPLALRVRMKTFEGLCNMVAHGVGLGIVPQSVAIRYGRKYGFRQIALQDRWAQRQLCLCYRHWDELSSTMQSLLNHLGAR